jgi:hypothetical protein
MSKTKHDWYGYDVYTITGEATVHGDGETSWTWANSGKIGSGKMRSVNTRNVSAALRRYGVRHKKGTVYIHNDDHYTDCLFEVRDRTSHKPLFAVYVDDESIKDRELRQARKAATSSGLPKS